MHATDIEISVEGAIGLVAIEVAVEDGVVCRGYDRLENGLATMKCCQHAMRAVYHEMLE